MDLGLYNKHAEPRGDHATLIGNWYEERSLQEATGYNRHMHSNMEKIENPRTDIRDIQHTDNCDYSHGKDSITMTSYGTPQTDGPVDKFFHRTSQKKLIENENGRKEDERTGVFTTQPANAAVSSPYEDIDAPTQLPPSDQPRRARYAMPITRYGPGSLPPPTATDEPLSATSKPQFTQVLAGQRYR